MAASSREIPADGGEISAADYKIVVELLEDWGLVPSIKPEYNANDAFSKIIGGVLKLTSAEKGKISCILDAKPPVLNGIGRLHGLVVASVAERVAIACAKSVVGKHTNLFLEELSISYLSSAHRNAKVVVDACLVISEEKKTIVAVSFGAEETGRVMYLSRVTFYNLPLSKL